MKKTVTNQGLVGPSSVGGRGVFAKVALKKGDIVETAPFLYVPEEEVGHTLNDYVFGYDENWNILVFGHGSMYNHSDTPNLTYEHSERLEDSFDYIALRDIKANEEMFIDYGKQWWTSRKEVE